MMTRIEDVPRLTKIPTPVAKKMVLGLEGEITKPRVTPVVGKELEVDMSDDTDTPVLISNPTTVSSKPLVSYDRRYVSIAGGIHSIAVHTGNANFITQRNLSFNITDHTLMKFLRDEVLRAAWYKNPFTLKSGDGRFGPSYTLEIPYNTIDREEYDLAVALGKYLNLWSRLKCFPRNNEYNVIKSELMWMCLAKGLVQFPKSKNRHVTLFIDTLFEYTVPHQYDFLISNYYNKTKPSSISDAEKVFDDIRRMLDEDGTADSMEYLASLSIAK